MRSRCKRDDRESGKSGLMVVERQSGVRTLAVWGEDFRVVEFDARGGSW